ncbi:MAG: hypothetical protein ACRD68_04975, partial [Pyrinomonadaceae bacterium]
NSNSNAKLIGVDVGSYNPLLGKSYTEVAGLSRSMHKSQGFGSAERRGGQLIYFEHTAGEAATRDLFDGVETSWRRVEGGAEVGRLLEEAARTFEPSNPQRTLPLLLRAHAAMNKLSAEDVWVGVKRRELLDAIRACSGLWVEVVAAEPFATPGGEVRLTTTLVNRSDHPFRLESITVPGTAPRAVHAELKNNQPLQTQITFRIPEDAAPSQPYWLREAPGRGTFAVADQTLVGLPERAPALLARLSVVAGDGAGEAAGDAGRSQERLVFETPVFFRWVDRVRGEQYRPFEIAPAAAVHVAEKVYLFPAQTPKPVRVILKANAPNLSGTLRLRLPANWRATPAGVPVNLKERAQELAATFEVTPPPGESAGTLVAEFETTQGRRLSRGVVTIDHPHVPIQTIFPPAEAKLVRVDLRRRGERVGYVMGAGDEIPEALRQAGYDVTLLSDNDLDGADLKVFDAVVTGVRAYNTRARLRERQARLLDYVAQGGTLVVQYNTPDARPGESMIENLGPFPLKLSRDRVTVEDAPVTILLPAHPLLNAPNKITAADFDGWVQERGLNFPGEWDARYQTPFATNDPGESPKRGVTLVAAHGRGTYVYTSFAWFRQLPAGVPGAYRLFVNMISAGKRK